VTFRLWPLQKHDWTGHVNDHITTSTTEGKSPTPLAHSHFIYSLTQTLMAKPRSKTTEKGKQPANGRGGKGKKWVITGLFHLYSHLPHLIENRRPNGMLQMWPQMQRDSPKSWPGEFFFMGDSNILITVISLGRRPFLKRAASPWLHHSVREPLPPPSSPNDLARTLSAANDAPIGSTK
jgi:hypothetical protein